MLKEYNKKRDFDKTSEPKGQLTQKRKSSKSKQPNRFVIQYHQARAKHFDFRLEYKGVLLSWAVPKGLSQNPKDKRLAVMVEDHPIDYINFEGVIPKGNYGAGNVKIYDKGHYVSTENFSTGLKKGHIKFVLDGEKHKGEFSLVKIDEKNWLILKSNDKYAEIATGAKKSAKNPFQTCEVELATLTNKIPKGNDWLFEIKYDGYRIISFAQNGKIRLLTRNNKDYTGKFGQIVESLKKIKQSSFVLDGEIVVFDNNGKSDFSLLQQNIKKPNVDFYYVIFDIIALNGKDLRKESLIARKDILQKMLAKVSPNLIFSNYVVGEGAKCFNLAKSKNLEGIMAKNANSQYVGKRTKDWLKIKCYLRQEFVIAGYTKTNRNKLVSAILLGFYDKDKLIFVGKVGTGLSEEQKQDLAKKFKKLEIKKCPFQTKPEIKNSFWLKPELVAEIQYSELTKNNVLRQPSFVGLRADKDAKDVVLEKEKK